MCSQYVSILNILGIFRRNQQCPTIPPPLLQSFLPLHLYLKVISTMRRSFQATYLSGTFIVRHSVGFGIFPGVFELFVQCAKILFPWGGMWILFEICEKRPFQKCMGSRGG